ncbi:MAG: DUF418 domain-containing protein [Vicinamibacterales bacterium]
MMTLATPVLTAPRDLDRRITSLDILHWIVQLIVAPIWLRYFQFGPLEWLWRSLTYWRRMPMAA